MTNFVAVLTIKSGKRSEYAAELRRLQLIENFRKQKGNIYYQIGESITDSDKMVVSDAWEKLVLSVQDCHPIAVIAP